MKVSPVVFTQGNESFSIPVKIICESEDIEATALVDSGAEGQFINHRIVEEHDLPTIPLETPIKVHNVDGTKNQAGNITEKAECEIEIDGHPQKEELLVTNTGKADIILGLPWLKQENPTINLRE